MRVPDARERFVVRGVLVGVTSLNGNKRERFVSRLHRSRILILEKVSK